MRKGMVLLMTVALVFGFLSGCATFKQWTGQSETQKPKEEGPNQTFYGFPDVPLPKEMTVSRDKTFVYEAPSIKAGVLVATGSVEIASVENYYKVFMPKNGWKFINSYKYGDTIMNYAKDDRSANVRISTVPILTTQVEIWVGPLERQYDKYERYDKGMESYPSKQNETGGTKSGHDLR
jgi:hypothetical protein